MHDLFVDGYVDIGILQSTYLSDFYVNGFNTTERNAMMKDKYPDRFILNSAWDPRDEEAGLAAFEEKVEKYGIKGVKLYTAAWRGDSRGWSLKSPWAEKYLEKCVELGVKNIHVHKGPTIWPLDKDSFDVADVDYAATTFTDLNFIVEHVGMPRIEDFCWIGVQEPNVYGGLAVLMPFIHPRPKYFGDVMAELLFWLGEDRLLFASDYALWHPKWLVEKFVDFDLPEQTIGRDRRLAERSRPSRRSSASTPASSTTSTPSSTAPSCAPTSSARRRPPGRARRPRARWPRRSRHDAERRRRVGRDRRRDRPRARPLAGGARLRALGGGRRGRRARRPPPADLLVLAQLRVPDGGGRPRGGAARAGRRARCRSTLVDHCAGERITEAMAAGLSFQEAFPDQAEGELRRAAPPVPPQGVRRAPGAGPAGGARGVGDAAAVALRLGDGSAAGMGRGRGVGGVPARGAATWAWTRTPGSSSSPTPRGPARRRRPARLPAPGPLGADQPPVEHGVLHRPARRALRGDGLEDWQRQEVVA